MWWQTLVALAVLAGATQINPKFRTFTNEGFKEFTLHMLDRFQVLAQWPRELYRARKYRGRHRTQWFPEFRISL